MTYSVNTYTNKKNKRVCFNLHNNIYIYNNINHDELWWSEYELSIITNNAKYEIYKLMSIHPYMTINEAKKLLYQPNNMSYKSTYKINLF